MKITRVIALLLAVVLVAAACSNESNTDTASRDDSGEITEGGRTGVETIQVGDCFDDEGSFEQVEQVASIPTVACDEPHDNQVVGKYQTTVTSYVDDDQMAFEAWTGCTERFASFIGEGMEIFPLFPTEASVDAGDREIICSVYNGDASKLTTDLVN